MIGKLRRKFIVIAMLSVTAVLAVLIGSINIFNFREVIRDADNVLNILTANEGEFPADMGPMPFGGFFDVGRGGRMSPEMRFEARFFTVAFDKSGNSVAVDTGRIAAVDSSGAVSLAKRVYASRKIQGFVDDYRYRRAGNGDITLIVFYDCGRSLDNARSFLGISIAISVIGLLVVFSLIAIFSKAVVKPVAEAYEKQKRFITDAGHEIKTPLAVINADCDVIEMESENNEWLTDIRKQTERLTELTNRLIYLAKTEEGSKDKMNRIDFPISDVVAEDVESFRGLAIAGGRNIETSITPDISYKGDQKAIRELVSVLMDNAIKYSPEGSTVKVSLVRNGQGVRLSVANDTVDPVSKKDLDHMFDRFYRTDESRNSETGGYGIGLSIARGITEAHGGKIYAEGKDKEIRITAEL
ncbi:MAG: HAMP domain-containing histidine kinase [Clostridiales bacterium]|nr:HAMP domain-containing histidine kinase [Clostridiales bacterium]